MKNVGDINVLNNVLNNPLNNLLGNGGASLLILILKRTSSQAFLS